MNFLREMMLGRKSVYKLFELYLKIGLYLYRRLGPWFLKHEMFNWSYKCTQIIKNPHTLHNGMKTQKYVNIISHLVCSKVYP
mgnify:CR=1 FL=1